MSKGFFEYYLEVFSVKQLVALFKNFVSLSSYFVLYSKVAHVKKLFIVDDKQVLMSVDKGEKSNWKHWPYDKLFNHKHSKNTGCISCKKSVSNRS